MENDFAWTDLTQEQRNDIETRLIAALGSLAITEAVANWKFQPQILIWQVTIEAPWCDRVSRDVVNRAREQTIKRAGLNAPMNGVILKAPSKRQPKGDFNQATFRVMQELIRKSEAYILLANYHLLQSVQGIRA